MTRQAQPNYVPASDPPPWLCTACSEEIDERVRRYVKLFVRPCLESGSAR